MWYLSVNEIAIEFILEEMYNIKSLQELMEHADEWKKQNQNNAND